MLAQADAYKNFTKENKKIVDHKSESSFHFSRLDSDKYNDTEFK